VSKATLHLFVDGVTTSGQFDLYQLNSAWSESTLTHNNAPGLGVSASGGHQVSIAASTQSKFILVDVTPIVQHWVDGTLPNHGFAIALFSTTGAFAFDSKESVLTSHEPELEIAPAGAAGPQGPQGLQGLTGLQDPAGPQGTAGATRGGGNAGPCWSAGVAGRGRPAGPVGPAEPAGPQGQRRRT